MAGNLGKPPVITWREPGFNMCRQQDDYDRFESLPAWALETLKIHEMDERVPRYSPGTPYLMIDKGQAI